MIKTGDILRYKQRPGVYFLVAQRRDYTRLDITSSIRAYNLVVLAQPDEYIQDIGADHPLTWSFNIGDTIYSIPLDELEREDLYEIVRSADFYKKTRV